jgi:plastocyanin
MDKDTTTKGRAFALAIIASMSTSCGSGTPTAPAGSGAMHTAPSTVMLESTGPNPREMTIDVGRTVSFMNHEFVSYTVAAGAGPSQPGCSEIGAVGSVPPGEIRPTEPFSTSKTCDYHVTRGQTVAFTGRIVVR